MVSFDCLNPVNYSFLSPNTIESPPYASVGALSGFLSKFGCFRYTAIIWPFFRFDFRRNAELSLVLQNSVNSGTGVWCPAQTMQDLTAGFLSVPIYSKKWWFETMWNASVWCRAVTSEPTTSQMSYCLLECGVCLARCAWAKRGWYRKYLHNTYAPNGIWFLSYWVFVGLFWHFILSSAFGFRHSGVSFQELEERRSVLQTKCKFRCHECRVLVGFFRSGEFKWLCNSYFLIHSSFFCFSMHISNIEPTNWCSSFQVVNINQKTEIQEKKRPCVVII